MVVVRLVGFYLADGLVNNSGSKSIIKVTYMVKCCKEFPCFVVFLQVYTVTQICLTRIYILCRFCNLA